MPAENGGLEALGSVSQRASVGNGARGLQCQRDSLGIFPARPGEVAGLPVGRRRYWRYLRLVPTHLFCSRALEPPRPHSQGTPLRPHGKRRQSWRGCEGVLFLPRLRANSFLHEDALQISSGRVPLRATAGREPPADAGRLRVRVAGHRHFQENRYFDVFVEYAKASADDLLVRITAWNRGPDAAPLDLLPTLWFRNTWSWGRHPERPRLWREPSRNDFSVIAAEGPEYSRRWLLAEGMPPLLFTENETNFQRLFGVENHSPYVKDGFHEYLIHGRQDAVNPAETGTKAAALYRLELPAGGSAVVRLRLSDQNPAVPSV